MRCRARSDWVVGPLECVPDAVAQTAWPAPSTAAPASGVSAVQPNNFLLVKSAMFENPPCSSPGVPRSTPGGSESRYGSRDQNVISLRYHVPQRHNGVVLVTHVVAVDRVLTQPVAEAEEEQRALVGMQLRHVLA